MSLDENFGTPSDEASTEQRSKKKIYAKRIGGDNPVEVVRAMPQIKSLKSKPDGWRKYISLHWGHRAAFSKDKDKTYALVFTCPRTFSRDAECAQCDEIAKKENTLAELEQRCIKESKSDEETSTLLAPIRQWLKTYNRDGGWYLNVMNQKGEFYPLKLNTTTKNLLEAEFNKYGKIPCMDVNKGLWFRIEFVNNGKNNKVEVVKESIILPDGSEAYKNKQAPLTDEQKRLAVETCPDLAVDIARTLTSAKIKLLVNCSGDPEEVSAIVNAPDNVDGTETVKRSVPTVSASSGVTNFPPLPDNAPLNETQSDEEFLNQYKG